MILLPREVTLIGAKDCRVQRRLYARGAQAAGRDTFGVYNQIFFKSDICITNNDSSKIKVMS